MPAYVEAALGDPAEAISYGNLDNVDMGGAATNGVGMIDGVGNDTGISAAAESAREGATR